MPTRLELPSNPRWNPFEFTLVGERERTYAIEVSVDLESWSPLATVVNTVGKTAVKDAAAVDAEARFYRARKLPD